MLSSLWLCSLQAAALCDKWNSILQSTQGEGPPSSSLPPSPRQQEQPSSLSPPSPSLAGVSSLNSNDAGGAASGAATVVIPFVPPEVVAARAAGSSSPHAQYLCPLTQVGAKHSEKTSTPSSIIYLPLSFLFIDAKNDS